VQDHGPRRTTGQQFKYEEARVPKPELGKGPAHNSDLMKAMDTWVPPNQRQQKRPAEEEGQNKRQRVEEPKKAPPKAQAKPQQPQTQPQQPQMQPPQQQSQAQVPQLQAKAQAPKAQKRTAEDVPAKRRRAVDDDEEMELTPQLMQALKAAAAKKK
jgi:hypothetical protein